MQVLQDAGAEEDFFYVVEGRSVGVFEGIVACSDGWDLWDFWTAAHFDDGWTGFGMNGWVAVLSTLVVYCGLNI